MIPHSQIKTYIKAMDNTGKIRNLSVMAWSAITGKSPECIRSRNTRKKLGAKMTGRQVVGLDKYEYKREKTKILDVDLINDALRRSLAPVSLEGMGVAHWNV